MTAVSLAKIKEILPGDFADHPMCTEMATHYGIAQLDLIRKKFAADHTVEEFFFNCNLAKANGVNPLLKQCVFWIANRSKAEKRTPVLVITIDGYRARAENQPDFVRSYAEVVCEKDAFTWDAVNQRPAEHTYGKANRGKILMAYHLCERKGRPTSAFVIKAEEFRNVIRDSADFHAKMPEHMMKKNVEAQGLRKNYPEAFKGTFIPEEMGGSTTATGDIVIPKIGDNVPPATETPRTIDDRTAVCEEIEDLFETLGCEGNKARREKSTQILHRKIADTIGLSDMVGEDLILIRNKLRTEKEECQERKVESAQAHIPEVLTPERIDPESEPEDSEYTCSGCGKEIEEDLAILFGKGPALCAACSAKKLEERGQQTLPIK